MKESSPKYPVVGVYVTTLPATDVVPCAGAATMEILEEIPLICAVRLIGDETLNITVMTLSTAVGGGGATTVRVTVAGTDVPPGPVAV